MNGLTLRISGAGSKKIKNSVGFLPITLSNWSNDAGDDKNGVYKKFLESSSADDQLTTLKGVLNDKKDNCNLDLTKFLVAIYLQADLKHPIKCFLTRYITKNPALQKPFSEALSSQLKCYITTKHADYKLYVDVVTKISTCLENFPAGAAAIKMIDITLAEYLKSGLESCVRTIRDFNTLSPTEKSEIFTLGHSMLRLLLHIIQKINSKDIDKLSSMLVEIRALIKDLVFDDDVPMDTKSVCGILYLTIHVLVNGPDSWVQVLNPTLVDDILTHLLSDEAAQLCLYSAIATVISVHKLQFEIIQGEPAIITLTTKILAIAERCPSESSFILGVTRTLLQLSKALDKVSDSATGLRLVASLLSFVWSHLEHYMDSVRHLSAQSLSCIVTYCTYLERQGHSTALTSLFTALCSLERSRKSYYVGLTCLTVELGARAVMERVPHIIRDVMGSLDIQAVQASATTALENLLQKHVEETNAAVIYAEWIQPILSHVKCNALEPSVLNILNNLMARAVRLDEGLMDFIVPYIKQQSGSQQADMKCILMLLSVARKSAVSSRLVAAEGDSEWRGIIAYDLLKLAAVDATEEIRILSLSLIVESPKTTEVFTKGELDLVLWYLKYNINAQAPHFRQLTLSMMKKFIKRLDDSYRVLKKQTKDNSQDCYVTFLENLRRLCFDSLIQGANYSRRCVAMQILVYCEHIHLGGYQRIWNENYVEKLLMHLDDSYENNKALALDILEKCPVDLLKNKKYSISLELTDIILEASSVRPTDCVSAAYKLLLLRNKLPEYVLQNATCTVKVETVTFSLLHRLLTSLRNQLAQCIRCVVSAARHAHMYGLLHCMRHLISQLDADAMSEDPTWSMFIENIILTCMEVNAAVACVVNNSSPEGHLPMDMRGVVVTDHGNSGGIKLEDGRQVTAQMVLLCAWRSVKEVSLLLGEISSRLTISGEDRVHGTLTQDQLVLMGEHFTSLLSETKHRGAFEQAYVGFTKLLARLWRCRSPSLHELPQNWLTELMVTIASGEKKGSLCATRRSAGLPFMIQALVTTELQVRGNPKCFHSCMSTLLRLARTSRDNDTKTHCLNILRALYKNSALEDSVAGYVGEGLEVALMGFEGHTWMERNSSTLLFSALIVRIFGVQRSRDSERLCIRNKMTGRIFFLRYPRLYDFMLEKLRDVSSDEDTQLRPSLYPILLLLSRLYPSSLEGTVSNLKLVAYIPHVLSCAKSSVMKTRQLAGKAMVPLVSPEQYLPHLESMLKLICDVRIKKNFCHGILLQLTRLLDAKPDVLIDKHTTGILTESIENTCWILEQAMGDKPCYLLADEYFKVINLIVWRFPTLISEAAITKIKTSLHKLLFDDNKVQITSGRDVCLANALYLYIIILNKLKKTNISVAIIESLSYKSYEVTLSGLNYLLILHKKLEAENQFQEHLILISDEKSLEDIRQEQHYVQSLCEIIKHKGYLECVRKSLKVITLERNTQKYIISTKEDIEMTNEVIIEQLLKLIENESDNVNYIYLESLLNFISDKLSNVSGELMLEIMKVVFNSSSSDNSEDMRRIVVDFLENNYGVLYEVDLKKLSPEDKFEYKATFWSTTVTLLEDDDGILRQRTSNAVISLLKSHSNYNVISSRSAELLRDFIGQQFKGEEIVIYVLLTLLDFKSEVCLTDEITEECRVFDQNERHNIFLEETIWTNECIEKVLGIYKKTEKYKETNIEQHIQGVINDPKYKNTFERLCGKNITVFKNIMKDRYSTNKCNGILNPKVELFVNKLFN